MSSRLVLLFAVSACWLDAVTTWAGLHDGGRFHEETRPLADLMDTIGVTPALAVSVLARLVAIYVAVRFAEINSGMRRLAALSVAAGAVASIWLVVLHNILTLTGSS